MNAFWTSLLKRFLGLAGKLFAQVVGDLKDRGAFDRAVDLAQATVNSLAGDTTLDNDAKRKMAIDALRVALKAEGKLVRDSLLGLAVELAVSAGKAAAGNQG